MPTMPNGRRQSPAISTPGEPTRAPQTAPSAKPLEDGNPHSGIHRRLRRWAARYILAVVALSFLGVFVAGILGLIICDVFYERFRFHHVLDLFRSRDVVAAMLLSAYTSTVTLLLVIVFCVPIGYALSRYRFPGHAIADTIVDLPLVVPPVVIGLSLLVFFATRPGRFVEGVMEFLGWDRHAGAGIILCQFLMSIPFAVRAAKAAFDSADRRLEELALTLGCTRVRAFWTVALPMARSGVIAGCIVAWARAVGLFGPLMVFVGCVRGKSEVLPTTIYLEVSTGGIEAALAAAMVMFALAGAALAAVHALTSRRRPWQT